MLTKIDHIGIAVRSLDDQIPLYRDILGLPFLGKEEVEREGVRVAFFQLGESKLELLEPLNDSSPIAKYLDKKGEGIHHIAIGSDDINGDRQHVAAHDIRLLTDSPVKGAHGKLVSFLHPKDTKGVLYEFCQRDPDYHDDDPHE